eukprot:5722652-Prymnesium_polylepis.1
MEWTNANGVVFKDQLDASNGLTAIAAGATDATTGAFPRGSVRFVDAVTGAGNSGTKLDLLVTVSPSPTSFTSTERINVTGADEYVNPTVFRQALTVTNGFACLGTGVLPSECATGAGLDADTGECTDGSQATMHGVEYDFAFVYPNTTTPQPFFVNPYNMTFFDVDGDTIDDGTAIKKAFKELLVVDGATEVITHPGDRSPWNTTDIVTGVLSPSAPYALVNTTAPVRTTFDVNPTGNAIPAAWLRGVVSFKVGLQGPNQTVPTRLKVVIGARLTSGNVKEGVFCFAPVVPELGLGC